MPSRRRQHQPPDQPPEFFIDRSLGRYQVPGALRALCHVVHTMAEVDGPGKEEDVDDEVWIEECARRGWVLLTTDERIRYVKPEREAIERAEGRVFRLGRSDLTGTEQVRWFSNNIHRIIQRSRRSGPFIDVVHENTVERQWPREQ